MILLVVFRKKKRRKEEILFVYKITFFDIVPHFPFNFQYFFLFNSLEKEKTKKKKKKRMHSKLISRETESVFSTSQGVNSNSRRKISY